MTRIPPPSLDIPRISLRQEAEVSSLLSMPDLRPKAPEVASKPKRESEGTDQASRDAEQVGADSPDSHPRWMAATATGAPPRASLPQAAASPREERPNSRWTTRHAVVVATAAKRIQHLARAIPRQTPFGWQRTVLLMLGGAVLAYGVTGGWKRGPSVSRSERANGVAKASPRAGQEIHRMSRAPLRVDVAADPSATGPVDDEDGIFHVPSIRIDPSPRTQPAAEQHAPNPADVEPKSGFPVISAPDGSAVSRRRIEPLPDPAQRQPAASNEPAGVMARRSPRSRVTLSTRVPPPTTPLQLPRETVAERTFETRHPLNQNRAESRQAVDPTMRYPHTDPSNYRDPDYVVPSMANRRREVPR